MVSLERFSVAKVGRFRCELGGWLGLGWLEIVWGLSTFFFQKPRCPRKLRVMGRIRIQSGRPLWKKKQFREVGSVIFFTPLFFGVKEPQLPIY